MLLQLLYAGKHLTILKANRYSNALRREVVYGKSMLLHEHGVTRQRRADYVESWKRITSVTGSRIVAFNLVVIPRECRVCRAARVVSLVLQQIPMIPPRFWKRFLGETDRQIMRTLDGFKCSRRNDGKWLRWKGYEKRKLPRRGELYSYVRLSFE